MFGIDLDEAGTRLRDLFTLKQPLRADAAANPDDVTRVKRRLKDEGHFDEPDYGLTPYPDRPLFDGIKNFQKAHDLKIDGIMNPGGETQTKMNDLVRARRERQEVRKQASSPAQAGDPDSNPLDSPVKPGNDTRDNEPPEHALIREYILARNEQANPASKKESGAGQTPEPQAILPPLPKNKPDTPEKMPPEPKRKPEIISPTQKGNELLDLIGQLESSDNYNVIYGNEVKPLTKMTIKEIFALQQKMINEGRGSSAVGRYQFIKPTLKEVIDKLGIDENALFDEKLQDRLARSRMEYRGFEEYKAGKISTEQLIKGLANEWASLPPDASNKSRYDGMGNNKALTKFQIIKDLLEKP